MRRIYETVKFILCKLFAKSKPPLHTSKAEIFADMQTLLYFFLI